MSASLKRCAPDVLFQRILMGANVKIKTGGTRSEALGGTGFYLDGRNLRIHKAQEDQEHSFKRHSKRGIM